MIPERSKRFVWLISIDITAILCTIYRPTSSHSFTSFDSMSRINSLWPSDAIWQDRFGPTLAQVMAWYLTTPNHYLNQCWLISGDNWYLSQGNFTRDIWAIHQWNYLENKITYQKVDTNLPGTNELRYVFSDSVRVPWSGITDLTLNVRGPSYLGLTMSISWLLMPWLLTSPGHPQPWYWLCRICRPWSYLRKDFNVK